MQASFHHGWYAHPGVRTGLQCLVASFSDRATFQICLPEIAPWLLWWWILGNSSFTLSQKSAYGQSHPVGNGDNFFFFFFFVAVLGLRRCTWPFSSCRGQGLLFVAVRGLLIAVASLVAEHGL